jgi:hypothetical protein
MALQLSADDKADAAYAVVVLYEIIRNVRTDTVSLLGDAPSDVVNDMVKFRTEQAVAIWCALRNTREIP